MIFYKSFFFFLMQGKTVNTKITCLREAESCVCVWPCVSLLDPGLLTVTFHDCPQSPTKCLRFHESWESLCMDLGSWSGVFAAREPDSGLTTRCPQCPAVTGTSYSLRLSEDIVNFQRCFLGLPLSVLLTDKPLEFSAGSCALEVSSLSFPPALES